MKHRVHTPQTAISAAMLVVCFAVAGTLLLYGYWVAAVCFFAIGCVYGYTLNKVGGSVSIQEEGIAHRHLLGKSQIVPWEEIREVGVIGVKVLNRNHPKSTGTMYLYFSRDHLSEDERFNLGLRWPPKNMPYLRYSYERFGQVRRYWKGEFQKFNTGNLYLGTEKKSEDKKETDDVLS